MEKMDTFIKQSIWSKLMDFDEKFVPASDSISYSLDDTGLAVHFTASTWVLGVGACKVQGVWTFTGAFTITSNLLL